MINEQFVQFPIGNWMFQQYIVIMKQWNGTMYVSYGSVLSIDSMIDSVSCYEVKHQVQIFSFFER